MNAKQSLVSFIGTKMENDVRFYQNRFGHALIAGLVDAVNETAEVTETQWSIVESSIMTAVISFERQKGKVGYVLSYDEAQMLPLPLELATYINSCR